MDDEATAEDRLEKFALAMASNDATMIPRAYFLTDDPTPFCEDVKVVVAKARTVTT